MADAGRREAYAFVHLQDVGIHGNGHEMMLEKNNLEISAFLRKWEQENIRRVHEARSGNDAETRRLSPRLLILLKSPNNCHFTSKSEGNFDACYPICCASVSSSFWSA